MKYWPYSSSKFQAYKLSRENTQLENIVFEKVKGSDGTVNRMSVYAEAAVRKALQKKCVIRNFAEFTRKYFCRNLFSDKIIEKM